MLRPAHLLRIERLTGLVSTQPVSFTYLLCVLFIVPGLMGHEPWKPDEAYVFGVVFQSLQSGEWVVPRLAGEAFLIHPPLFYLIAGWIGAALSPPLELHDAVRLASGVFMAATLALTALTARELLGPNRGWVATLMLLGCAGLLLRSHQLIPDLAYLMAYALSLYAVAISARNPVWGGLMLGTGVGLAFMIEGLFEALLIVVAAGIALLLIKQFRLRAKVITFAVAALAAAPWLCVWPLLLYRHSAELFAQWFWQDSLGRISGLFHLGDDERPLYLFRLLPWFGWPILPLAAWGVWLSRRTLMTNRALLLPLIFFLVELLGLSLDAGGRDVQALPLLLPLAILATYAVSSLPRSVANAWFWFSIMLFTFIVFVIWFYFCAIEFGLPARLAEHMRDMQPGYAADTPRSIVAIAAALAVGWFAVLFNVRRTPERPVILWTAGVTIVWSTLILLLVGYADTGKSYRWMVSSMQSVLPAGDYCVASENLGETQRAMLHYYAGLRTDRRENPSARRDCDLLLIQDTWKGPIEVEQGWQLVWQGARPGDNVERYRLFRKLGTT